MHPTRSAALLAGAALGLSGAQARAEVVTLAPVADTTIYEDLVSHGNGAGQHVFCGKNAGDGARRALLRFDVAGALPAGAVVRSASLRLYMSKTTSGSHPCTLHRLLESWAEGLTDAPGNEGAGDAALDGDCTWLDRVQPTTPWTTFGGLFVAAPSATRNVAGIGSYTWDSTPQTVADVQLWLDDPAQNFGWILRGNEASFPTSKRYASRQNATPSQRPVLTIEYDPGLAFCDGSDGALAACPCANPGLPDTGCENAGGTGGVGLAPSAFLPDGLGGGTATLVGTGYPPASAPTAVVIRSPGAIGPVAFGDGIRCLQAPVVRLSAASAVSGSSTHPLNHGAGPGDFHYQLWYRSTPASYCTPDAFNASSAYRLTW
jgi:hypothetical protein